jgi:hypothetical protein
MMLPEYAAGSECSMMGTGEILMFMVGSVIAVTSALTFMEVRRIRKNSK